MATNVEEKDGKREKRLREIEIRNKDDRMIRKNTKERKKIKLNEVLNEKK